MSDVWLSPLSQQEECPRLPRVSLEAPSDCHGGPPSLSDRFPAWHPGWRSEFINVLGFVLVVQGQCVHFISFHFPSPLPTSSQCFAALSLLRAIRIKNASVTDDPTCSWSQKMGVVMGILSLFFIISAGCGFLLFFFFLGERKRNFTAFLAVGMSGRKSIIYTHTNTLTTSSRTLPTFLQECEIVVVKLLVCRVEETILLKNLMILGILFVICKRCYIYIILYVFMSGLCSLQ